jgi:hypothetical protein
MKYFIYHTLLSTFKVIKFIIIILLRAFRTYIFDFLFAIRITTRIYRYIIKKSTYYEKIKFTTDNKWLLYILTKTKKAIKTIVFFIKKLHIIITMTIANTKYDKVILLCLLFGYITWFYYSLHLGSFIMFMFAIIPLSCILASVFGFIILIYQMIILMI